MLQAAYSDAPGWQRQRVREEFALLRRLGLIYKAASWFPWPLPLPVGWAWEPRPGDGLAAAVLVRSLRPDGAVWLIDHLAVHPGAQGHGVGRELLTVALDGLHQLGAHVATLEVLPDNAPAARLYATAGFRRVDDALDLLMPADVRPALSASQSHRAADSAWAVRPYHRSDQVALSHLVTATLPWTPRIPQDATSEDDWSGRLRSGGGRLLRWLTDRARSQRRQAYVVTDVGQALVAFAEVTCAGSARGGLAGLVSPYHRLRVLGHPQLSEGAAAALVAAALAPLAGIRGPARPILTTVSGRLAPLVAALQEQGFAVQEHRDRLALDLKTYAEQASRTAATSRPTVQAGPLAHTARYAANNNRVRSQRPTW